jgi:hypothetical protein
MTAITETVHIASLGRDVQVKELSVSGMRELFRAREEAEDSEIISAIDMLTIDEGMLVSDLTVFCDVNEEEIDHLTYPEVRELATKAKELNADFFDRILGTLAQIAKGLREKPAASSSETP